MSFKNLLFIQNKISLVVIVVLLLSVTSAGVPSSLAQGTACSPVNATIAAPFYFDGAGTFCWQSNNLGAYINSWNLTSLTVNGVNFTNVYVAAGSYPAQISGYWYVAYNGPYAWSHFEAAGTGPTPTTGGPTNTPTRTPTVGGPTNTPTRTNTPGGPTNTPTRTPTRTPTVGGATNTPTRTPTRTNTPGVTNTPTRTPTQPSGGLSMRGADVSSLQRSLDLGETYLNASGAQQHPLDILQSLGVNYIRLRVWVNPASGYNNQAKVVAFAPQVKSRGMKLMIDFHYSDTWADPGKQFKPAAWNGHNLSQLQTDVYNHTLNVCNALKNAGATPDMIQVGNEITPGMLWEEGRISNNNFANVSALIKQGYNAVKACSSSIQVALHIDKGGDNAASRWWYDGVKAQGVNWDVTALSYYCFWHGSISAMQSNVADMKSRYGKPVIIVETAYPFTTFNADSEPNVLSSSTPCSGYSASWSGQASNFNAIKTAIQNAGGAGVFYWEPTWVATAGNGWDPANINGTGDQWDNMAIFDANGNVNPNLRWN